MTQTAQTNDPRSLTAMLQICGRNYNSVAELFESAARQFARQTAFECFGQALTYAELERQSRAVAAWLQTEKGVKRGDRIALMCPNIFAFPIAMLGILRAGAAQVNVNPLYTPTELAHQLNDSGAGKIIIFAGSTPVLADIIDETPVKDVITVNPGDGTALDLPAPDVDARLTHATAFGDVLCAGADLDLRPVDLTPDDTIFFQYTGGTTGLSKGAVLTHNNLLSNVAQFKMFMPEINEPGTESFIAALPLYHIFGLMLMLAYLADGSKTVLIPNPRDMDAFVTTLEQSDYTVMAGVNTLFTGLMMQDRFRALDFSGLKATIGGGAPVLKATSDEWCAVTGKNIKEGYGLSETSPLLTLNPYDVDAFTETAGLPAPGTEIAILREDNSRAETGEPGEICARGPQVMPGYWNREDANEEVFTDDGFFRTGDIGLLTQEGYLKIVDRKKDMVLVSGFNVYPAEIEAVVTQCSGVVECACIGVPDDKTGEAVVVYVVKDAQSDLTSDTVIAHCRDALTGYKIPRRVAFLPELPKSNVGKILRRELRQQSKV